MRTTRFATGVGAVLTTLLLLAGCGATGDSSSAAIPKTDQKKAQAIVASVEGKPSAFPITEPLTSPVPPGSRVAYVDNGDALVALMYQLMRPAAKALGVDLYTVRAGTSASGVATAFSTVAQQKPAAVINTAIDPALWENQRKKLIAEGVPIVSLGTMAPASTGLVQPNSEAAFKKQGRLQAAWLVANNDQAVNTVLYVHRELAYSAAVEDGFQSTMKELCSACTTRIVEIPITEIGNKAPQRIVSDLQSHPDTDAIVFQSSAVATGLPSALKVAGLDDVQIVGANPVPTNLQYLKDKQETVELGVDLNALAWTAIDTAGRLITGQKLQQNVTDGSALVQQFLRPEDITFDPTHGFAAYPDAAARFKALWGK